MSGNATMISVVNRTSDSTVLDLDHIAEKINYATTWIKFVEAHIVFLKAKIAKELESNKTNRSTFGDCTEICKTFCDQVLELWTAVLNYKIRFQNETNKLFNVLVPAVMGRPLYNREAEIFRRQIIELGDKITPVQIIQTEVVEDKEKLDVELMEKQREMIKLIAEVGYKMEQAESHTHPRQIQKNNEKLMKIKICRCIINSVLVKSNINYEENPELLALKIKWRNPISLKSKRH